MAQPEIRGLTNIVANMGTLHSIHYEPLFTIRYYDRDGYYAETEWILDPAPFWHVERIAA